MGVVDLYDQDAERALLASLILGDNERVIIDVDDFSDERHRLIFRAIGDLRAQGAVPDARLVAHALGHDLEAAGGVDYLLDVTGAEVITYNAPSYAKIVRELADRRRMQAAGVEITTAAIEGAVIDPHAVIDAHTREVTTGAVHVRDLVAERMGTLGKPRPHVSMQLIPEQALHHGDLVLVAARPGIGKSALGLQMVHDFAERGIRSRVYSLEMKATDWIDRLVQQMTPVTGRDFDRGLSPEFQEFVTSAMQQVRDWPLEVSDRNVGVSALAADLRRFARRGGKVAVIDYLGLLVSKGKDSRYDAMTEASRTLKSVALETGLLVIALAQLNREGITKDGKIRPPVPSDLRESGALEQDADVIVLIHRYLDADAETVRSELRSAGYYFQDPCPPLCHVQFAKVRRGVPETYPVYFRGDDMLFERVDKVVR